MPNDTIQVDTSGAATLAKPGVWDREFNTALLHVASKLNPRGFRTLTPAEMQSTGIWEAYDTEGRPALTEIKTGNSIYGCPEVEMAVQAALTNLMLGGKIGGEHTHHKPMVCPLMLKESLEAFNQGIVDAYGDDERTQKWRKALAIQILTIMAYVMVRGRKPEKVSLFVQAGIALTQEETVQEVIETGMDNILGLFAINEMADAAEAVTEEAAAKPTLH